MMSSGYVADYKQAEDELRQYGVENTREELRYTLSAYRDEEPDARPQTILKEAVRNIKAGADEEREWHERETEHIPSWMDEERITAERYEEGPQERESGPRIRAW
jgi:hypothetical protein